MAQVASPPRRAGSSRKAAEHGTRRTLNTPLLLASLAALVVAGGTALAVHSYFASRIASTFLQRAATLEEEQNWTAATAYLGRYLQLEPSDLEARLRLLSAVEKSATDPAGQRRLVSLLYQMTGSLPERIDLKVKLVEQLLATQRFKAAEEAAQELLEVGDDSQRRIARRAIAVSKYALSLENRDVTLEDAVESLQVALQGDPGDVVVATLTAQLYRDRADAIGPTATDAKADEIMDKLVAAKPDNVDALLARYNYRRRYQLREAQADLDAALKLAPDRLDVLLLAADADLRSGHVNRRSKAEGELRNAIKIAPLDPRPYVGLARYLQATGQLEEAISVLKEGRGRLTDKNLDIDNLLTQYLIESGQLDEARAVASDFARHVEKLLSGVSTSSRIQLENMRRSLDAKIAFESKDFGRAARESEAIILAGEKAGDAVASIELLDAYALLGSMMSQANRPDLAANHWAALSERSPGYRDAAWKAGLTYLALGRTDDALSHLNRYRILPGASPEAYLALVQARLQEQLSRPVTMRDWSEYKAALKEAQAKLPNRWELQVAQIGYLAALNTRASRTAALELLREIEKAHAKESAAAERLVILYQQFGQNADAQRVLDEYRKSSGKVVRGTILQAGLDAANQRNDEALQLIEQALENVSPDERRELEVARIRLLLTTGKAEEAQQNAKALIDRDPKDPSTLAVGIELALLRQDFAAAEKWEGMLKEASTVDNFDWNYFRARRLISQFANLDSSQRDELEQLVTAVRTHRPAWAPVMTLSGQFAELRGDTEEAIAFYRSAIEAGDRRTETLQLLTKALFASGRHEEAKKFLSQFRTSEAVTGQFESMAIESAVQGNRLSEARTLAQQAVDRNSKDPLHYVWLASLKLESGDREAAEQTFRTALERFPRDARVWQGVFLFFVQTQQPDKARVALERWTERVPLAAAEKEIVLGDGKQLLGESSAAESHYRKSIELEDRNVSARFRLAKLLMDSDVAAAREQFDAVLQLDPNHKEARQYLAAVLAASGDDEDWTQAVQLLERSASVGDSANLGADDRLHAILLARKGKNQSERRANYRAAQDILTKRLQQPEAAGPAFDVDRMLLAGIYEQQARLDDGYDATQIAAAREVLRPLVERSDPKMEHLLFYIQLLMRHLNSVAEKSTNADEISANEAFALDVRNRIEELATLVEDDPQGDRKSLPTALRVKLLSIEGKNNEGKQLIEQYAERELAKAATDSERAKVYLRIGGLYQSAEFDEEAENWFRKLVDITPSGYVLVAQSLIKQGKPGEAIDFCINAGQKLPAAAVATVLAQILSSDSVDPALDRKAQPLIDAALDSDRGNVDLLMSVAVQRVTRNDLDEAAKLFKRVIELQPRHTLALNNLATLYAEQPTHLAEAQEYVERAMTVAGRNPALLDTLGTILLRAGKFDEAVTALEESVAGSASDPRYYFHLAAAYQGAAHSAQAKAALNTAMQMGLDRAILTEGDRELLASLRQQLLAVNNQN